MIKFRIHGRGGQGGVTLAKVLAFMYWTEGKWVQAFGSYSAERTGAPILAFTLVDEEEITNRNIVYEPDHLIVLESSLLATNLLQGLQPNAYIFIDTALSPEHFKEYPGHRVATVDAKKIARKYKLGTATTPITNTAIAGALARIFNLNFLTVSKTIEALHFPPINTEAAKEAYEMVQIGKAIPGQPITHPVVFPSEPVPPLVTGNFGTEPKLNVADWKGQEPVFASEHTPPCNFNCPAGNDIQGFIAALSQGNYDTALAILRKTSPLPASTSRVCPHPCEDFCNRKDLDAHINIHELERLAADRGHTLNPTALSSKKQKVAVIGSGPAGLSAAYQLRLNGYQTVIFEALPKPGGMLVAGIPEFRLPKEILEEEVAFIQSVGVEIRCNSKINNPGDFERLLKQYDAVIIAIGLSVGREMTLNGSENSNIIQGVDFLRKVNFGEKTRLGTDVIVIGGGNTAIDASRSSLRLGAENVTIVYRRGRDEMPAIREEIEAAVKEGVNLKFLNSPHEVINKNGKSLLKVQKMALGEPDESGRRKPVPVPNQFEEIPFSTLILATGQISDLKFADKAVETKGSLVKADPYGITSNPKVFATGDIVTNDGTITHAIGHGRKIALAVENFLKGEPLPETRKNNPDVTTSEQMNLYYFSPSPRINGKEQPVQKRIKNFEEVNLGIEDFSEAIRCLSCGVCNGCHQFGRGKCELFCPERTIKRLSATQLDINYQGCKGCLICMEVCPRNAMGKRPISKGE